MNILFRNISALELNIYSLKDRMLFYQEHYYDNIYFVDLQGSLKGYYNYAIDCHGQTDLETAAVKKPISVTFVYEWFHNHPGKYRVPMVDCNGLLIGEFYDSESNEECLYKRIEDRAFEVLSCLKADLREWAKDLTIAIIDNTNKTYLFRQLLPEVSIVTSQNNSTDFSIDLLHTPHVRELLGMENTRTLSPSQVLIPLLIKKVFGYCCSNDIHFYVFNGIMRSDIKNRTKKEIENESLPIEKVLQDTDYLKSFCGDDSQSYEMLLKHSADLNQLSKTINNGIYNELVDFSDEGVNFTEGKRLTTEVPEKSTQTVHIFGPCVVQGLCVVDCQTIPSWLQRMLKEIGYGSVCVINHGISYGKDLLNDLLYMMATPLAPNDIIVWVNGFSSKELTFISDMQIPMIDGKSFAFGLHNWYLNNPFHCNSVANKEMARVILHNIVEHIGHLPHMPNEKYSLIEREHIPLTYDNESLLKSKELDSYVNELSKHRRPNDTKNNGCVVVNANPCTNGHLHLIGEARKEVDFLYVFLVEQNTGPFKYLDRELMLKESIKDLDGVEVISGGSIFTTSKGYPGYFNRSGRQTNPLLNHKIFAKRIAPALNISKRFFGEEPDDDVTRQLNVTALEYLPKHGVEVKIIDRLTFNEAPVSAKTVRKLYYNRQYESLEKLVPEFVFHYLKLINK